MFFSRTWAAATGFLLFCGSFAFSAEVAIRWVAPPADPLAAHVEVTGLKSPPHGDWKKVLSVYLDSGSVVEQVETLPMVGTYSFAKNILTFQPQYRLYPGAKYRAVIKNGQKLLSVTYSAPKPASSPLTVVTQIFPTTNIVPENLLKFYVQFSAPMSSGHIYDYIRLNDEAGKAVELPFLEIDEELWDPEMKRLTLFIDPGRIKRGVKPLEEIGPSLVEGQSFSLVISNGWHDANNRPMKETYTKYFKVGPPQRLAIDPAKWKVQVPAPNTTEALRVDFLRPLDHAIVLRKFWIRTGSKAVAGNPSLDKHESRWNFVPEQAWTPGSYEICFEQFIEDLAGNNIGKAFEVDVFDKVDAKFTNKLLTLPFNIP